MSEGHGRAADIWSLGCVVIEMATGNPSVAHLNPPTPLPPPPLSGSNPQSYKEIALLCSVANFCVAGCFGR